MFFIFTRFLGQFKFLSSLNQFGRKDAFKDASIKTLHDFKVKSALAPRKMTGITKVEAGNIKKLKLR